MTPTTIAAVGGTLGALGVGMGAFGAHAMASRLSPERLETWQTAAHYQLVHAVALVALAGAAHIVGAQTAGRAAWAWTVGVLVFSGSLYALCLSGVRALGAITPLGGLALIAGWAILAVSAARASLG